MNTIKDAMIIGGGRSSYYLADILIKKGISVKIIEKDLRRCELLNELLPKATIINGTAMAQIRSFFLKRG